MSCRLRSASQAADVARVGHITTPQMLHVLRALHSQARGPDAPYFVAMVDPLGKGDLTFQELASSMRSCVEAGTLAWQKGNAQVTAVISKVKGHLIDRHATVLSLFREFDRTGRGFLELGDLLRLFRRAVRPPPCRCDPPLFLVDPESCARGVSQRQFVGSKRRHIDTRLTPTPICPPPSRPGSPRRSCGCSSRTCTA